MRLLIAHKLFLALLAATAAVIVVALLLTQWSFNRGFLDYINAVERERILAVAESLATIHAQTNSWEALTRNPQRWHEVLNNTASPRLLPERIRKSGPRLGPGRRGPPMGPMGVPQPIELLDADRNVLFGKPVAPPGAQELAINDTAGKSVGYVRYVPLSRLADLDNSPGQRFIAQQRMALLITAVVALLIAALLALVLGRRLVAPLQALVRGTEELRSGKYTQPVPVHSSDEIGQLTESFNAMGAALAQARLSQQQWLTDIAHELRTPLTILSGELQALEDGVRDWNAASSKSLHAEIERLHGLIDDLRELSLSDAGGMGYQRSVLELDSIVTRAVESHRSRINACGLSIEITLPNTPLTVAGDARRLEQLLSNLLENSCRYTDPGGLIRITCTAGNPLTLCIEDTSPGVPAEALPRLFDRLYRVEQSRSRRHGGSGLGLAICKGIVEAHGGTIRAAPSTLGGLAITVLLPHGQH